MFKKNIIWIFFFKLVLIKFMGCISILLIENFYDLKII